MTEPCEHYEREPGSDDDVQMRPAELEVRPGSLLYRADAKGNANGSSAVPADGADV